MKVVSTKTEVINGQIVEIKVLPTKWARGTTKKQWTAKSKNYLLNGMNPK